MKRWKEDRAVVRILSPVIMGATILAVWHLLTEQFGVIPEWQLPSPIALLTNMLNSKTLLMHTWATLSEQLTGFGLALVVGFIWGTAMSKLSPFRYMFYPYLIVVASLPDTCFAPILIYWIGPTFFTKVLISMLIAFFVVTLTTMAGFRQIPLEYLEAAELDGAGWVRRLFSIEVPLAARNILVGIKLAWGGALIGAVVSDLYASGSGRGLGYMVMMSLRRFRPLDLFSAVTMVSIIAVFGYVFFGWLEERIVRW